MYSHHFLCGCLVITDDLHEENYPGALGVAVSVTVTACRPGVTL